MHDKDTAELLAQLKDDSDIHEFLSDNKGEMLRPLNEYLGELLAKKQLVKAKVIHASGLERTYAYHIFDGQKPHPARPKLLALARTMKLDLEETQHLLRYARHSMLYPRNPWDAVIIVAIEQDLSVTETNRLLDELGEKIMLK